MPPTRAVPVLQSRGSKGRIARPEGLLHDGAKPKLVLPTSKSCSVQPQLSTDPLFQISSLEQGRLWLALPAMLLPCAAADR